MSWASSVLVKAEITPDIFIVNYVVFIVILSP